MIALDVRIASIELAEKFAALLGLKRREQAPASRLSSRALRHVANWSVQASTANR